MATWNPAYNGTSDDETSTSNRPAVPLQTGLSNPGCGSAQTLPKRSTSTIPDDGKLSALSAEKYKEWSHQLKANSRMKKPDTSYVSRYLLYMGEYEADMAKRMAQVVGGLVDKFVQRLVEDVQGVDPRFSGRLIHCGSFFEGVKVKVPNEFDFVLELDGLSRSDFKFTWCPQPPRQTHQKDKKIHPRSLFKIQFRPNNETGSLWADVSKPCGACISCLECARQMDEGTLRQRTSAVECKQKELSAESVQNTFFDLVRRILDENSTAPDDPMVQLNGPAVTIYAELPKAKLDKEFRAQLKSERLVIKVDITLAIKIEASENQTWPFEKDKTFLTNEGQREEWIKLDDMALGNTPLSDLSVCHLVPRNQFWKVSFVTLETEMVRKHSTAHYKGSTFKAIKFLRDTLSATDQQEDVVLGTYPLKITFLKKVRNERDDWREKDVGVKTVDILETIEEEGAEGTLTEYFIEDSALFMESDKSYLESRRLLRHLKKQDTTFKAQALIHIGLLLVFFICDIVVCGWSSVMHRFLVSSTVDESDPSDLYIVTRGRYIIGLLPPVILMDIISLSGLGYIGINYCSVKRMRKLYRVFTAITIIYLILFFVSVTFTGVIIKLVFAFYKLDQCACSVSTVTVMALYLSVMSSILFIGAFVYAVTITILLRKRKFEIYNWIFWDDILKRWRNRRRRENERLGVAEFQANRVNEHEYVTSPSGNATGIAVVEENVYEVPSTLGNKHGNPDGNEYEMPEDEPDYVNVSKIKK